MTAPRVVRQRIADEATASRDETKARIADLKAELADLEKHVAMLDQVCRVVGIEGTLKLVVSKHESLDVPEFARAGNG